ncbi:MULTISPECIES: P1 family peptidase [unclassified Streptomyces]|uniref:P1 family peptidase n=1 Tax=unclassified Streptomyces TaxID=2593676 RepID=UPI002E2D8713|nr:P1 family peptidase [Streptomyces sp. NBC_01423]WSX91515.1 P1 family peptidase [Streptomyces sp. NBC_00891]WSY05993.1 P1 family peptidase [Streptomyces sp. NBC_00890]WSZ07617.1 P1 family peptidase [Streptomyces sp. NBC_00869]WSZ24884.1 P1 family peptidase [Streptomyces sp. NBC_00870]
MTRQDALTDVRGLRVGHARVPGKGALSGTTVVLAPEGGVVAAVDVRGGGPGTRETDALDPRNLVQRIDAVVLTGGSAFGLDAASGVMAWLEERGRGVRVGADPAQVVPVVPAACVFDLGRGGDWRARPDAATGRAAVEDAARSAEGAAVAEGCVGAGTGAVAGRLKGGVGSASVLLPSGVTVGALVVVNAAGSVLDPRTGVLFGEYGGGEPAVAPPAAVHEAAQRRLAQAREANARPPLNTTLAVVATDACLTRAQAQKLAGTAHDGLARAIRPVHLMTDGDTVFALATGREALDAEDLFAFNPLLAAGAEAVARAIVKAVRAATGVEGRDGGGTFPSYGDLYGPPSHAGNGRGGETDSPPA